MSNMRIMILSFLLILLIVSSVHGVEENKAFCNETIMDAMATLRAKTPEM
ncbi:hypothetical protein TNCT_341521, partial [Trichonephila clavata]